MDYERTSIHLIGIMQRKNHNRSKDDTLLPRDILMAIPAENILF